MADRVGFPYCTKWKNYRYPLTRLTLTRDYTDSTKSGYFGTAPLDIWISDDYFLMDLATEYIVKMTAATNDRCQSIKRPGLFADKSVGQHETTGSASNPLLKLDTSDAIDGSFDIGSSLANTISSEGDPQSLYTIIPGVHFNFTHKTVSEFSTNDAYGWTMKSSALDGVPKVMDGTYTCWYQLPTDAGDTVVTDIIPNGIANKSMTIMWNANRHVPKRSTTSLNNGQTIYLQGSVDKVNWFNIAILISDMNMVDMATGDVQNFMQTVHWDSNATDGDDFPYKRLKFAFEASSNEVELHPHQFIQVNIIPN